MSTFTIGNVLLKSELLAVTISTITGRRQELTQKD